MAAMTLPRPMPTAGTTIPGANQSKLTSPTATTAGTRYGTKPPKTRVTKHVKHTTTAQRGSLIQRRLTDLFMQSAHLSELSRATINNTKSCDKRKHGERSHVSSNTNESNVVADANNLQILKDLDTQVYPILPKAKRLKPNQPMLSKKTSDPKGISKQNTLRRV